MLKDLPYSLTIFRLPRSHWSKTLANYRATPETAQAVRDFVSGEKTHLLLTGKPGTGKTHLSIGLYRWAVSHWGTEECLWVDFPEFVMEVKRGYGNNVDVMEEVREATRFICLDDFFGRKLTDHEAESILYPCIQIAHRNQARLVLTTNYTLEQIAQRVTPHELDRIMENCRVVSFMGASQRR